MKNVVSMAFVLAIGLAAGVANADLVGHWDFDHNFRDLSGNGNHADYMGLPTLIPGAPDGMGAALSIDAVQDGDDMLGEGYLVVQDSPSLSFGADSFTLALWMKADEWNGKKQFLIKNGTNGSEHGSGNTSGNRYVLKFDGGFRFAIDSEDEGGKENMTIDADLVANGEWVHVAAVRNSDTNTMLMYVNGELIKEEGTGDTGNIDSPGEIMTIGGGLKENQLRDDGTTGVIQHIYDGALDDIRFYNTALSAEEIAAIPEPATLLILGVGAFGMLRRRKA